jgi:hypothetical protein
MGGPIFKPNKPEPQLEHHDKLDPHKKEPELAPPLFGLATRIDPGVAGRSPFPAQPGVAGTSDDGDGVFAESTTGNGVHARGGNLAGLFEGNVEVTGNINLTGPTSDITLQNEDCAEQFNVLDASRSTPGTVMVLDDEGLLRPSRVAYDKRVAGVISGAGRYRPAMTLGVAPSTHERAPIALMGKVYCWADADRTPIEVGDLLTTSPTEGHAMAVSEPARAVGTIIGKALQPLASGKGLIPILVALQ